MKAVGKKKWDIPDIDHFIEKVFKYMSVATKENSNSHMDFTNWEWPTGVGIYGLFKYYKISKKEKYLHYMFEWFDKHLEQGLPPKNVNSVAPLLTLAHLYEINRDTRYLNVCKEWAEWIMNEMPRTEERGLQHITILDDNKQQLWDDTLFMTVLFLAKMAVLINRKDYYDEAVYQFLLHIKYLYDTKTGLWFHGWCFDGRHNFGKNLWARGNCWFTSGVVEFLEITQLDGPVKQYFLQTLENQVKALAELQEEDGMWHTLLDDPSSYVEASATAGFGYGILKAVRKGYIDRKYLEVGKKAMQALISCIAENGEVQQVSYGTAIGMNAEHYKQIPICPTAYGQSLAIMVLTEGMQLKE